MVAVSQLADTVAVFLGNGDGTFGAATSFPTGHLPIAAAAGDFRNNGQIDLAVVDQVCNVSNCGPGAISVLLGNGNGTFQNHVDYPVRVDPLALAIGDFNGDGKLDLAVVNQASNTVSILLGNGDGTFKSAMDFATGSSPTAVTTGDFNGDGKLDLAVAADTQFSILLGNGDGTFQPHVDYPAGATLVSIVSADFNGDSRADLAVGTANPVVSVFLGHGDGTFAPRADYPSGASAQGEGFGIVHVSDFNGDGIPDLAVGLQYSTDAAILLGNGDGTFQRATDYRVTGNLVASLTVGDFNGDGVPDLAVADPNEAYVSVLNSISFKAVYPAALRFLSQGVGTSSSILPITISNPSNVPFSFSGATTTGDFSAANNCGATVAPSAHCVISVIFSPAAPGTRSGTLTLTDTTESSPQIIPLSGTGVNGPFLALSATKLSFAAVPIGSPAAPQTVMILNTGNAVMTISNFNLTGANASDFSESNTCANPISAGQSCTVSVTFDPTAGGARTAALAITDTAPGSPHLVNLAGTALAPAASLSVSTLSFASQPSGTTSSAQTVSLSNTGNAVLTISQISTSANFAQSNNCGSSVQAAASCQITVTFVPSTTGALTGSLTVMDNAAGSPMTVALSGTSISASLGLSVSPGSSSSATAAAGGTASYTLVIGGGGVAGTASLGCSGAPRGVMCSVPNSVNVSGSSASTITVTVGTTSRAFNIPHFIGWPSPRSSVRGLCALCGFALILVLFLRRLQWRFVSTAALVWMILILTSLSLTSCGGGSSGGASGNPNGTPAGTYTLTVTAVSGTATQSTQLTLIVQ